MFARTTKLLIFCCCLTGTARAESMAPDVTPPSCSCDDDCKAYHNELVCYLGECLGLLQKDLGTPCPPCEASKSECAGGCYDLSTDVHNCGSCGIECGKGFECLEGSCACDGTVCDGVCVNLDTDHHNCGQCGNWCGPGREICQNGNCTCLSGDTVCSDECVDLETNRFHCGACDNACPTPQACREGLCGGKKDDASVDAGVDAPEPRVDAPKPRDDHGVNHGDDVSVERNNGGCDGCEVHRSTEGPWAAGLLLLLLLGRRRKARR